MSGNDRIEIACKIVDDDPDRSAIAIADGTMESWRNENTGKVKEREKWIWLPRSQVTILDENSVRIPEWLAKREGLI